MKSHKIEKITYKSDAMLKQIRMNVFTIASYLGLLWLWQFSVSYQSSLVSLMNVAVLSMWIMGTIGVIFCREDAEEIIKKTKHLIFYYLSISLVYDLFIKAVLIDMVSTSSTDETLLVAKKFLDVVSVIAIKIGIAMGFNVWMVQKFSVFKNAISKQKQMEILRGIRKNFTKEKSEEEKTIEKDNMNNRF